VHSGSFSWRHFPLLRFISSSPEVVGAFLGREFVEQLTDDLPELLLGAGYCLAQPRLSLAPVASTSSRTAALLYGGRSSKITTSPGRSVGTRICSTKAHHGLVIGPCSTMDAVTRSSADLPQRSWYSNAHGECRLAGVGGLLDRNPCGTKYLSKSLQLRIVGEPGRSLG
jgi:hypothetical protein